jgi:hypothetical protein
MCAPHRLRVGDKICYGMHALGVCAKKNRTPIHIS